MTTQRIIGLTGGIATGKSTVTTYLTQRYQLPIFDADVHVRKAIAKNHQNEKQSAYRVFSWMNC
ncbi:dephospho-CoA kinase [Picosynechococcus sp. PCC 8807]|uniref:dephospho-CoA kinase n=1 Tax=Picosynechococcus sp. PCC 8807 TaxID=195248 RepID=UPI000810C650|nr:dephospho-CoA kinase [Picosynechococcus sp. PCC 8807]ANV91612.1 hypothetical protein AWQ24_13780 [Picosynechococcus sp. PCC 8807]